jgi:hypothetical protein
MDAETTEGAAVTAAETAQSPASVPSPQSFVPDPPGLGATPVGAARPVGGGRSDVSPSPVPRWIIPLLALLIVVGFLFSLVQDVGRHGRTWLGWLDTTAVTTTDYQPLVSPHSIVYPDDFPSQFRLDHLPANITLNRLDSLAIYRLDDNVVGYSVRGNVIKQDGTADALKAALDVPDYQMDFWMGSDTDNAGDFWAKWNVTS